MIDVFRVGVHMGFTSNGAQVMGLLTRELGLLHGSVDRLAEKWTKMRPLIAGAVAGFAGVKALEGMWKMVEASKDLNKELNRTRQLGGEFASTVGEARLAAFRTAGVVPTTTAADNVKVQRELGAQMQNTQAAADILPVAQRTAFVISNFTGEKTDDIVKNLVKVAELRAQIFTHEAAGKEVVDQAKVKTEFDAAMRALLLTGGFLKSNDLVQLAKQAGVPAKGMTAEAFYADAAEMSVSQGASRTGTALTSMYQQLVGGTMQKRVAEEMERMGLFKPGDYHVGKGSAITVTPAARARLAAQIGPDPITYITGPLNDLMNKRGMDSKAKLDEVFQLFGRQTTQRLVAEALSSGPLFERARHMFGVIPDADTQYKALQTNDLDTNIKSFTASWHTLMQALGEQGTPLAITIMTKLTGALQAMTAWAVAHPEAVHAMEVIAASMASLAAVGGTLTVASVAVGAVVGGFKTLAGITGLAALGGDIGKASSALAVISGTGVGSFAALAAVVIGLPPLLKSTAEALGAKPGEGAGYGGKGLATSHSGVAPELPGPRAKPNTWGWLGTAFEDWAKGSSASAGGRGGGKGLNRPQSYRPPAIQPPVQLRGDVNLDGRKVGEYVANSIGRDNTTAPRTGATGADVRMNPFMVPSGL